MGEGQPVREKKPNALKGIFFLLILLMIFAGLGAFALANRSAEGPLVARVAPLPIPVEVETVKQTETLTLKETYSGLAAARRTSALGFASSGLVADMRADVGDKVRKGEVLARLDTRSLEARLTSAEADIAEADAQLTLAQTDVRRQRTLYERGHVAEQLLDEAVAAADAAQARIRAARAAAEMLRVDIDLSIIQAPFTGTVTRRFMDEGAIAGPGTPLLELVEAGHLEARIGIPADTAADMSAGQTYELRAENGPVQAVLRNVTGVIDTSQRTITAVFDIPKASAVPVGAVVRLPLARTIEERGFWAPVSALTEANRGLWSLYVIEPGEGGWKAAVRPVEIVHTDGDRAYVRGAVSSGEQFIIDGLQRLTPGQPVAPPAALTVAATGNGAP